MCIHIFDDCNLVIPNRFLIVEHHQYKNDFAPAPRYLNVTATPAKARLITWKRPSFYVNLQIDNVRSLHVINLHLKSKILPDSIFNADESAMIKVCEGFNRDTKDVPVEAIRGDVENKNDDLLRRVMLDDLLVSRNKLAFYRYEIPAA
jgi:hypothetical protein